MRTPKTTAVSGCVKYHRSWNYFANAPKSKMSSPNAPTIRRNQSFLITYLRWYLIAEYVSEDGQIAQLCEYRDLPG